MLKQEFDDYEAKEQWGEVFKDLGVESKKTSDAKPKLQADENRAFNRYVNITPYDETRVKLDFEIDYINANYVKVPEAHREYILTQGPITRTISHFWLMIWQQNVPAIVMLNKLIEEGKSKCAAYYPDEGVGDKPTIYADVHIGVKLISRHNIGTDCILREYAVLNTSLKRKRKCWHYQFVEWPDFGVPDSLKFIAFMKRVRDSGFIDKKEDLGPLVVHCSAGVGRSGSFILLDSLLNMMIEEGGLNVDLKKTVLGMRDYRTGLVQTKGQLRFCYLTAILLAGEFGLNRERKKSAGSDDTYVTYITAGTSRSDASYDKYKDEHDDDEKQEQATPKEYQPIEVVPDEFEVESDPSYESIGPLLGLLPLPLGAPQSSSLMVKSENA